VCRAPLLRKGLLHPSIRLSQIMATSTSQVQEYWLPGYGLSRNIVLSNIQYFLGPSATVRPYTYQVKIPRDFKNHCADSQIAGSRRLPHCWHALDKGRRHPTLALVVFTNANTAAN
jgi:hypothetical protein